MQKIQPANRAVLSSAVAEILEELENRFANDPFCLIADSLQTDGQYTISFELADEDRQVDGDLNIDMCTHQAFVKGAVSAGSVADRISLYADMESIAFSSENIHAGNFWGTHYNTFLSDVGALPLIGGVVGDKQLESWNAELFALRSLVGKNDDLLQTLRQRNTVKELLPMALLAYPAVEEERTVSIGGQVLNCTSFIYEISGDIIPDYLRGRVCSDTAVIKAIFYLHETSLLRVQIQIAEADDIQIYDLYFGEQAEGKQIRLCKTGKQGQEWNAVVITDHTENFYKQTIVCNTAGGQDAQKKEIHYCYDRMTGLWEWKMSESETFCGYLQSEKGSVTFATQELRKLCTLPNKKQLSIDLPEKCTLTVKPGSKIVKPEFRNIREWSLEDIVQLVMNFGLL